MKVTLLLLSIVFLIKPNLSKGQDLCIPSLYLCGTPASNNYQEITKNGCRSLSVSCPEEKITGLKFLLEIKIGEEIIVFNSNSEFSPEMVKTMKRSNVKSIKLTEISACAPDGIRRKFPNLVLKE